jgi:hypothetical protein
MHIHMSKKSKETFDPKPAVDPWMETASRRLNQGGASAVSASSTTQEAEGEDSEGDTEEGSEEDR